MERHGVGEQRNIVLIGLMGAGKTTVGRIVAERLNREFVDTDDLVEQTAGKPVRDVFAYDGEQVFRNLERQAVAQAASRTGQVIGLGGGAVCDESNVAALRGSGELVLLDAAADVLAERVVSAPGERPLLTGHADTATRLAALRDERDQAYASSADWTIDTAGMTPDEVADAVLEWLAGRRRPIANAAQHGTPPGRLAEPGIGPGTDVAAETDAAPDARPAAEDDAPAEVDR